jgi:hypothetical protein
MRTAFGSRSLRPLLGCALLAAASSLAGCSTYKVSKYAVSVANAQAYKEPGVIKVKVAPFTADKEGSQSELSCRAVGPVQTPAGETFAAYVQGAMTDELTVAGLLDQNAPVAIKGHLSHLDFSSTGDASWQLTLVVTVGTEAPFTVQRTYGYESSFLGEKACALTAQAFMPAVQDLLGAIAKDPAFRKAMTTPPPAPGNS